ncbi:MAG TPA: hypothetical protein VI278_15635, partial [Nitrososphaeraceae archaeon]
NPHISKDALDFVLSFDLLKSSYWPITSVDSSDAFCSICYADIAACFSIPLLFLRITKAIAMCVISYRNC